MRCCEGEKREKKRHVAVLIWVCAEYEVFIGLKKVPLISIVYIFNIKLLNVPFL